MPLEFLHTTFGVSFLAVLAVISHIIVRDRWDERARSQQPGDKDQGRKP